MRYYYLRYRTATIAITNRSLTGQNSGLNERFYGETVNAIEIEDVTLGTEVCLSTIFDTVNVKFISIIPNGTCYLSLDGVNYYIKTSTCIAMPLDSVITDLYIKGSGTARILIAGAEGSVSPTTFEILNFVTGNPSASTLTADAVWYTTKPANSRLQYGTTLSMGTVINDSDMTQAHKEVLTGLTLGTTYFVRAYSETVTGEFDYSEIVTVYIPDTVYKIIESEIDLYVNSDLLSVGDTNALVTMTDNIETEDTAYTNSVSITNTTTEPTVEAGTSTVNLGTFLSWSLA